MLLSALTFVVSVRNDIVASFRNERGQDLVEYAVLVGAIGVAAAVALFALSPDAFDTMRDTIEACVTFDGDACL
jgi:Flp pilus assembly pilin Flp